jgi:hypothetical protein
MSETNYEHQHGATHKQGPEQRGASVKWLRERLATSPASCGKHFHAECLSCGSVKCCGQSGYTKYEKTELLCHGCGESITDHLVVPFTTFGEAVGFPPHCT